MRTSPAVILFFGTCSQLPKYSVSLVILREMSVLANYVYDKRVMFKFSTEVSDSLIRYP